jgi:protein-disulfide isomerase
MNKTTAILGTLGALIVGFFIGKATISDHPSDSGGPVKSAAVDPSVERYKVTVGKAPVTGSASAKVTIIEFSDYQCPFCSRVEPTIEKVKHTYGKDVRVAFKHSPLPFHPNAAPAARAAMAAQEQGVEKFWAFHAKLFENQDKLDEQHFAEFAQQVGLDVSKFKNDLGQNKAKYDAQIEADKAEAAKFGANGTPHFFINGRKLAGAQPFENFQKIIDEELGTAERLLKGGVRPDQLYASIIQNAKDKAADAQAPQRQPQFQLPDPKLVYKVPVGEAAVKGPRAAKVTIIEYSDFQCPYCSRVVPTLKKLTETFGNDVRIAFKHNPLPFHDKAQLAAEAASAAGEQGKFWEMHDKMFENQQALKREDLEKYAQDLGLNLDQFKGALDSGKFKQKISADAAEAAKFGAHGTPSFFVNGKPVRGAQPYENFEKIVKNEIDLATAKLNSGVALDDVYEALTREGQDKAPEPPKPAPAAAEAQDNVVYKALIGDAPVKGPKESKVTIVMWSDFQCPFCSRVEPTIDQIMKTYPKEVRVAFKQLPLPFHDKAHLAAEASLAAKEQGKFWQMHDILFKNQQALKREDLEKYAQELGLNMHKFREALDSGKFKAKVDEELAEGNKIGANGTPAFFINGKSLSGAQPFEAFKAKIDAALAEVDAMEKHKRIPLKAIYDEIMKGAKEQATPPPAAKGGGEAEDKTVYKVDPGNGPSWGSANAPVTIVEFSDFQCPFCSRVLPTIKKIKENFAGKVRIVWRNFPLPFHQDAPLAAEAALAANAQGKFWEMHDKMFENQRALDRASLERYAAEIGLDLPRFKADLDGSRYKSAVQADVQYGSGLPGGGMGTPTFFINGRKLAGAYPYENFEALIKAALADK